MDDVAVSRHRHQTTWFQQPLALEDRPALSGTGDVWLYAGKRFPTTFRNLDAAIGHAREASDAEAGAVAVLERHGRFHLSRAYNGEMDWKGSWELVQSDLADGGRPLSRFHPDLRALVDDGVTITP